MSDYKALIELARKADEDASLLTALQNARTAEAVATLAAEAGIAVSVEEVEAYRRQVDSGELTDADLEKASGGTFTYGLGDINRKLISIGTSVAQGLS